MELYLRAEEEVVDSANPLIGEAFAWRSTDRSMQPRLGKEKGLTSLAAMLFGATVIGLLLALSILGAIAGLVIRLVF